LTLATVALLVCSGIRPNTVESATSSQLQRTALMLSTLDDRGPVTADTNDSDDFFQSALRTGGKPRDYSKDIESLLKRMTLEEKVGQMTQLQIGMISNGKDQDIQIDPTKLEKAVVRYGVGSVLNVQDQALPLDRWHQIIRQIQEAAAKTRLKI